MYEFNNKWVIKHIDKAITIYLYVYNSNRD